MANLAVLGGAFLMVRFYRMFCQVHLWPEITCWAGLCRLAKRVLAWYIPLELERNGASNAEHIWHGRLMTLTHASQMSDLLVPPGVDFVGCHCQTPAIAWQGMIWFTLLGTPFLGSGKPQEC
eukprot:5734333-Amphidinium_carterae.1